MQPNTDASYLTSTVKISSSEYEYPLLKQMFKQKILALTTYGFLIMGAIHLTGCATKPAIQAETAPVVASAPAAAPLTAEFIYQYLIAEIAGQRDDFATSSSVFYHLAKTEEDPRLAERAAKTAAFGNVSNLIFPAVELWAQLDPTSTEAQQAMTEMLIRAGKLSEAEPYLAQLLVKEDTRAAGFLFVNALLSKSPNKEDVLKITQSLAKPYPNLAEAQFSIAQAALAANQNAVALAALNNAETLKPGWSLAALLKGQMLFNASPQSAIDFYQAFIKKNPKSNEIRLNLAKILVSQKQFAAAKKQYPIILNQIKAENARSLANKNVTNKNLADVTAVIGLLSFQSADYIAAEQYFQQALDLDFKEPDQIYLYLAQNAEKQQQDTSATNWYNKVSNGAYFLEAQLDLANLIARTQTVDLAIAHLDRVENLSTEQQILVIQSQASLLAKAKRNQEAFDLLGKAVKNMPNTPELVYDYALAAERVLKFDVMESELRKSIAAKPDFAAAYNALGYSFADRNIKLDEAVLLIKKALTLAPNDHYMLDSLGWAYYRKGNLEEAITYLQQAYKINPDPEIAAHLGEVLWQKGQHDAAKKIWNDALIENPNNEVLQSTAQKFKS